MIFTLANIKGGSSKSTTAIHLADALSARGKVLIVDMDPQGSVTEFFFPGASAQELEKGNSFTLMQGASTLAESLHPGLFVDVVPSVLDLCTLGNLAARQPAKILKRLRAALEGSGYAHVVIDTPGSLGAELTSSLVAADCVLIPVTPSVWTAKAVGLVLGEMQEAQELAGRKAKTAIVPTMFGKSKAHEEILSSLKGASMRILSHIPRSATIQKKTESGERIKAGSARQSFETLASEVTRL